MFKSFTTSQTKPTSYREEIVARKRLYRPPVTDGLVLWLDSTVGTTSTTWTDRKDRRLAALRNGAAYDPSTRSIEFDGIDDYAFVPNNSVFDMTDAITVSVWFQFTSAVNQPLLSKRTAYANDQSWAIINNGSNRLRYQMSDTGSNIQTIDGTTLCPNNTWHKADLVYDRFADRNAYGKLDNQPEVSFDRIGAQIHVSTAFIGIATQAGLGSAYCPCKIGDIKIYNRALSDRELTYNFDLERSRYGI